MLKGWPAIGDVEAVLLAMPVLPGVWLLSSASSSAR
jgi:hypothetical protein